MQQICQKIKFNFILISAGYNLLWRDERITVKILEESVNFIDKKSATTGSFDIRLKIKLSLFGGIFVFAFLNRQLI